MGVSGQYVRTFAEGNLAICTEMNLDAQYPHVSFDIIEASEGTVRLKGHRGGTEFEFPIKKGRVCEYAEITQQSSFAAIFGVRPKTFRICPMKGERF